MCARNVGVQCTLLYQAVGRLLGKKLIEAGEVDNVDMYIMGRLDHVDRMNKCSSLFLIC